MNYCNCPNCQTVNCPNAPDEPASGAPVQCSALLAAWRREATKASEHAKQWESGDNWKNKKDDWMAEVCRMRAHTLNKCIMQLEKAANKHVT